MNRRTAKLPIRALLAVLALLPAGLAAAPMAEVLIERPLAERTALEAGDTCVVIITGVTDPGDTVRVAGVFDPPPDPSRLSDSRRQVIMPLPLLEARTGNRDAVSRIVLTVRPDADPASVADRLNRQAFGYRAHTASDLATQTSQVFVVVSNFHRAISVLAVLAGAVFLAAIVLLQIQELRKPLGVLRLIGISRRKIFAVVLGETILLANIGAATGVALGFGVSIGVNRFYQAYFDTALVFSKISPAHVWLAVGVSTAVGIIVGSLATLYLFQLRMTEVLGR